MQYVNELKVNDTVNSVYMVKDISIKQTNSGKPYLAMKATDKTGMIECRLWDLVSEELDFANQDLVRISGRVVSFNGALQLNVNSVVKVDESECDISDFIPTSPKDPIKMWEQIIMLINGIMNPYLKKLLEDVFINDMIIQNAFRTRSAAKGVHHAFAYGLLHHTLNVAMNGINIASQYPIINRDLLVSVALLHDIGKVTEITPFPENDYSDEGKLLGHIVSGILMIKEKINNIPDFPEDLAAEVLHCIAAHHGELQFGSPKTPSLVEALALSFADNLDAKMEIMIEELDKLEPTETWLAFNKYLGSNIRRTTI
jgi:3'-5' exoribonuclease